MNAGEARFLLDGLSRRSLSIKLEPEHNRMYFTDVHREHTDLTTDSTVYRWKRWHGAATSELPTSWYLKPKTRAAAGTTSCRCSVGSRPCSTSSRQLSCAGASRRVCLEIPRSISRSVTRRKCSRTCSASCSLPWPSISLCGCGQTSVATRLRGLQLAPRQARLCKFLWQNTFPLFPPPPTPACLAAQSQAERVLQPWRSANQFLLHRPMAWLGALTYATQHLHAGGRVTCD